MKNLLIIFLVFISCDCFSQDGVGEKNYGHVNKLPMIDANVYGHVYRGCCGDYNSSLTARSKDSKVYSIIEGKVSGVFKIDNNNYALVVRSPTNIFYAYANLDTVYLSRDCQIKKGTLLGESSLNSDNNLFECTMMIATNKGNYIGENKMFEMIKNTDDNFQDSSFETIIAKY